MKIAVNFIVDRFTYSEALKRASLTELRASASRGQHRAQHGGGGLSRVHRHGPRGGRGTQEHHPAPPDAAQTRHGPHQGKSRPRGPKSRPRGVAHTSPRYDLTAQSHG